MSDGMLQEILELERQIAAELVEARSRAESWLAEQKEEIDQQAEIEKSKAAAAACCLSEKKCQSARREEAERLVAMRRQVRRLRNLPDAALQEVLNHQLLRVLGGRDDYPDG